MKYIYNTNFEIIDRLEDDCTVSGLVDGLALVGTPGYASGVDTISGDATINAAYQVIQTLRGNLSTAVTELNVAYPGLNLALSDTVEAATVKMIAAGVSAADSQRLKTIYDTLNALQR